MIVQHAITRAARTFIGEDEMRTGLLLLAAALVPASTTSQQPRSPEKPRSAAVFARLTALVGNWEGTQDGVPIKVTYTLIGDGSALMEYMTPGDSAAEAMVTMFTVDGGRLLATHYCAAHNQPQMVTAAPGNLEEGVAFSLVRVTGLRSPDDWHNTGLTLIQDDKDHITQRWTYSYKGQTGTNVFRYTRK
jgi:hypothetical protein